MLRGRKAYERGEFIASTDERFRPVYLSSAPDGTLYVVDMYRGIIQHKGYITEYLRDQILSRKLERPQGHGRIYRVVHTTTKRGPKPALSATNGAAARRAARASERLVARHRAAADRRARGPLGDSGAEGKGRAGTRLADAPARDVDARRHRRGRAGAGHESARGFVAGCAGIGGSDCRALAERREAPDPGSGLEEIDDKDWAVRRQLAASLGALPDTAKVPALVTLLERHGDDPITVDAAVSGLNGSEHLVLERLLAATEQTPQRTGAAVVLAATLVRGGEDARLQELFQLAGASGRLPWQRDALLEGAEAALLGGPLPGSGRRGAGSGRGAAAAAALSTASGGRAGPGGAAAFPSSRPPDAAAAGRGRGTTAVFPSRASRRRSSRSRQQAAKPANARRPCSRA